MSLKDSTDLVFMLLSLLSLPLLGFISGIFFGNCLGPGVCYITTGSIFLTFCISTNIFYNTAINSFTYKLTLFPWLSVGTLHVNWSFYIDNLTSLMLVVVTFISFLVHFYSIGYMAHDPHVPRFMSYLSLFTFFMVILVTANNFLQMFVGWEGVGVSSYLLINFWFTRIQANKAAIKAMLVNRFGDFFILLAFFGIASTFDSLDYDIVFAQVPLYLDHTIRIFGYQLPVIDTICLLLFLGAMGKSAQFSFHTWLPDAMEGPTPVSALIHAATMVTAGVFILARCSFLFEYSPLVLHFIMLVGASTGVFASSSGLFQNDLKKVVAYSTCSQLGYMIFACGLSNYDIGIFHLTNHAFFKALLFLGAGSIIHANGDEQDMRKLGGLRQLLPLSYAVMLIGSLTLAGSPFLAGFYSKDLILEQSFNKGFFSGAYCYTLGTISAFFTSFYSTRLITLVFLGNTNGSRYVITRAHEGSLFISLPLVVLALISIFFGFFARDFFIGTGTPVWLGSIFVLPEHSFHPEVEFLTAAIKALPSIAGVLGVFASFYLYVFAKQSFIERMQKLGGNLLLSSFFTKRWGFDKYYSTVLAQYFLWVSYDFTYKIVDRGLLETMGPMGIVNFIKRTVEYLKVYQSGQISYYISFIVIAILFIILIALKKEFIFCFFLAALFLVL
jgi:proton-translocating NADH-quinone oxidoreductase chain L